MLLIKFYAVSPLYIVKSHNRPFLESSRFLCAEHILTHDIKICRQRHDFLENPLKKKLRSTGKKISLSH